MSTPAGKASFQTLGVSAGFERSMIPERNAAGIARARAQDTRTGKGFGRPKPSRSAKPLCWQRRTGTSWTLFGMRLLIKEGF